MSGPVMIDSSVYRKDFYGILNADGRFWTPMPFESHRAADEYLTNWVNLNAEGRSNYLSMLTTHKIVPVNIRLTLLPEEPTP